MSEIRPIPGFEGYGASDDGLIWSAWGMGKSGLTHQWIRPLRPGRQNSGYWIVALHRHGSQHTRTVHRLVWEAFHGPRPDGMEINHRNGDKADNSLANLELVTSSGNKAHARSIGLTPARTTSKLTPENVSEIRKALVAGESQSSVAARFGVRQPAISDIVTGKTWRGVA